VAKCHSVDYVLLVGHAMFFGKDISQHGLYPRLGVIQDRVGPGWELAGGSLPETLSPTGMAARGVFPLQKFRHHGALHHASCVLPHMLPDRALAIQFQM